MQCFESYSVPSWIPGCADRRLPGLLAFLFGLLFSVACQLEAQTSGPQHYKDVGERQDGNSVKKPLVTLQVRDSTLRYVLYEIARQANLRVVYDDRDTFDTKKVSVSIKQGSAMQAFAEVLKGTGFAARLISDGKTVTIHATDSKEGSGKQDSVAQNNNGIISGRVKDSSSNQGIAGATISVVGVSASVITGKNGEFVLVRVPTGKQRISIKLLGYQSVTREVEVKSGSRLTLNVNMVPSATSLSEVVTTATGLQRRVEVPSDIVKVDAEKMRQRAPIRSVADMIEAAQVPGVVVTRASGDPGAATRVRIRGIGSISQSNDPVYIVDGMWVDASVQSPSRIDQIDPETIETIEIVRGPSAATLYGQDAANGVIVITTKKGTPGTTRWNMSYNRDWGQAYGRMPLFYEGLGYNQITGARRFCSVANVLASDCVQDSVAVYDPNNRLVMREGQAQTDVYSLSMDGGSNSVKYALTASSKDQLGVRRVAPVDLIRLRLMNVKYDGEMLRPSLLKDHSLSSNLSLYPRENLDIVMTVRAGYGTLVDNGYNFGTLDGGSANVYSPDTLSFLSENVARDFSQIGKKKYTNTTSFGSTATWRNGSGTVVTSNVGIDQTNLSESGYGRTESCKSSLCVDGLGRRNEGSGKNTVATLRTNASTLLTRGRFRDFLELSPAVGFDFRRTKNENFFLQKDSVPGGESSIESGRVSGVIGRRSENATAGWYLNSRVGILKRIYFDLGIRQDIGSAITTTSSSNLKYPKLGGAWLLSNEGFWPENKIVNILRLRGAIGHAAVQPDIADVKGNYIIGTRFIDGKVVRSLELNGVGNSELVPERSVELEVGFDMYMFNERVTMIATYAHKENKNTLVSVQLPSSLGRGLSRKENIGRVQNRNVELTINSIVVDRDWVRVLADYSHTISDNRVKSLGKGVDNVVNSRSNVLRDVIAVGYPIGGVWRRRVMGYFDDNGDGMISQSERIQTDEGFYLGSSTPRYIGSYGINATFFGKLTIDSRFSYRSNYVPNYSGQNSKDYGQQDVTAPLIVQAYSGEFLGGTPVSDFRWNSASVSYSLPSQNISFLRTRSMTLSLQANNIGLWTKFPGRDPWVNTGILTGSEMLTVDYGVTPPPPRTFSLNVRMGL